MADQNRDSVVGSLLEQFLGEGIGSIRSILAQAYIMGQEEAYERGCKDGIAAREKRGKGKP